MITFILFRAGNQNMMAILGCLYTSVWCIMTSIRCSRSTFFFCFRLLTFTQDLVECHIGIVSSLTINLPLSETLYFFTQPKRW